MKIDYFNGLVGNLSWIEFQPLGYYDRAKDCYDQALGYYDQALGYYDRAQDCYDQALNILKKIQLNQLGFQAYHYQALNCYDQALGYYDQAENCCDQAENCYDQALGYHDQAENCSASLTLQLVCLRLSILLKRLLKRSYFKLQTDLWTQLKDSLNAWLDFDWAKDCYDLAQDCYEWRQAYNLCIKCFLNFKNIFAKVRCTCIPLLTRITVILSMRIGISRKESELFGLFRQIHPFEKCRIRLPFQRDGCMPHPLQFSFACCTIHT